MKNDTPKKHSMALDLVEVGDDQTTEEMLENRKSNDLPKGITSGMLYRDVIRIAWPAFVEMSLTQLAAMINMMMVGRLGASAIAAVGLTTQPRFLLMTLFMALNVGATAMVARSKGAGDQNRANLFLRQALMLNFAITLVISALGFFFAENMVSFMGAQDYETLSGGTLYLQIQMLGFPFFALTATITAALRGVGETRVAMVYNVISNIVNVTTGFVLIYGHLGFPRLELAGASIALVAGQGVAFILALSAVLSKKFYVYLRLREGFMPNIEVIRQITKIGIPSMVEQLSMRVGMIVFNINVAGLGTVAFATHHIAFNIQALSFMTGMAFAVSATSLVGQSLGKKAPFMAHHYAAKTRRVGMVVAVLMGVIFFFFGAQIIGLYTPDPDIISLGAGIMMMMAFILPIQSSQFILAGALRGAGDTRSTAIIMIITVLILRPAMVIIAIQVFGMGLWGAWIAIAIDQCVRSGLVAFRFYSGKWKAVVRT